MRPEVKVDPDCLEWNEVKVDIDNLEWHEVKVDPDRLGDLRLK